MTPEECIAALQRTLDADPALAKTPGKLLYSSSKTLKPFPIYFVGTNPGGTLPTTLAQSLIDLNSGRNEYLDYSWERRAPGQSKLQKQVQRFLGALQLDAREVPASNVVMTRSTGTQTHTDLDGDARRCWPLHQIVLEAVRPQAILAFGSGTQRSAFSYLLDFLAPDHVETIPAEQPPFSCHAFGTKYNGRPLKVLAVPHLTRYSPHKKPGIMEWITRHLMETEVVA